MSKPNLDFVVFSDDWGRHPSSCQHLFRRLSRRHRVLWVNTIGMRAPKADGFTVARGLEKLCEWTRPLTRVTANLHVYSPPMLLAYDSVAAQLNARWVAQRLRHVQRRLAFNRPILFTTVPTAADYLGRLDERAAVYYITDDYRFWPGANPEAIAAQDAKLTDECDLLLPVGDALAADRGGNGRMMMLPHAVDLEHFVRAAGAAEPADLAAIPHPRLCFFGLIYEKIDLDLLARLAREQPDKDVVLIGPTKTDLSAIKALPNAHVLGPKPYAALPAYLNAMDVLLLAYRLDEQTTRNAPLKIRECLAAGKPVVAKGIPDLERYAHLTYVTHTDDAYLAAADRACRQAPATAAAMREAVAADSWEARARQVETALVKVLRPSTPRSRPTLDISTATDAAAWDAYVAAHADGSIWRRWDWPQAMLSAYGMPVYPIAARRGGRIVGILPLALQASRIFGRHLVSLPWLDYAGILADDETARSALLAEALRLTRRLRADLTLRTTADRPPITHGPTPSGVLTDKVAMTLDLPTYPEELWSGFRAKVRNQIRKARKSGLTAHLTDGDGLSDFHRVYTTNMRDLGSPPHSMRFFAEVLERFADEARLVLVHHNNETIAGAVVLADDHEWQAPWASSLRETNAMCPNHLMYWTILAAACGEAERFCFGRSSRDSGTYRFKEQWGAVEQPLAWRTWGGNGAAGTEGGRVVTWVQQAWRRLPVPVARTLGPHIIRCVG